MDNDSYKERRNNMLERYLRDGIKGFKDNEIIEMFAYCSLHGQNAEATAKELLDRFGSIYDILKAKYEDLLTVKNVNKSTAALICYLKDFIQMLNRDKIPIQHEEPTVFKDIDSVVELCKMNFAFYSLAESGCMLYLDDDYKLLCKTILCGKNPDSLSLDIPKIVKTAVCSKCKKVIMVHTHPTDDIEPSGFDMFATKKIICMCRSMSLNFVNHIIVHNNEVFSMRHNKNTSCLWTS